MKNKNIVLRQVNVDKSKPASDFVKTNIESILFEQETGCFEDLRYTDISIDGKKERIYFLETKRVDEFFFSSGEYFLLSILKIVQTFANRRNMEERRLLIIDEIELSLHPFAQARFIQRLVEWAKEYNFCAIFATHSLPILSHIDADSIYYIDTENVYNSVYPGYIASKLYQHSGYDRIILVEDRLAKRFIEKILVKIDKKLMYKVIPIGGYEKVLEIQKGHELSGYFGNAKVVSILDGDVKDKIKQEFLDLKKNFLPISNIERYTLETLFKDDKFTEWFEAHIIPPKKLKDIVDIKKIENEELKSDTVKRIFKDFINESSKLSGKDRGEIEDTIVHAVLERVDTASLGNFIRNFFE